MSGNTKPIKLTEDNFQSEVLESKQPVLVDFWAPWCGPCRMVGPIVEELAEQFASRAKVSKLNIDDFEHLATEYDIQAIPTLLLFKNGQVVERVVGVAPLSVLADKLTALEEQNPSTAEAVA